MNGIKPEGLITVRGGAYTDVRKALHQWLQLYADDLPDGLQFRLYRNGRGKDMIQTDGRLDDDRFYYMVNYSEYPEGHEYQVEEVGEVIPKGKKEVLNKRMRV